MAVPLLDIGLTSLSQNLAVPDELLKKGNEYMQKIFLLLQKYSSSKVDRCRLLGGVGKKTSLSVKFDYDCVIYVNDLDPPFDHLLDDWHDIFLLHLPELKGEMKMTNYSIQFKVDEFDFDILPAPNYKGVDHDLMSQANIIWKKISQETTGRKRAKISRLYSGGLSELALQFIQTQSSFIHNLCRLAKFWNCTILFEQYVSGRSSILECLAVKAGQEEEQAATNDKLSLLRAFRRFLISLTKNQQIAVMFFQYYDQNRVPMPERPYVIDPSNPYNNLLADVADDFLPTLTKYAAETLKRLDNCEKNFPIECAKLFDPQPNLGALFKPHIDINSVEFMIGTCSNNKGCSPTLIVRRDKFDSVLLEQMKQFISCALTSINDMYIAEDEESIRKKVIEATTKFVDRSFYGKDNTWVSATKRHEDCDITFILPLKTKNNYAVMISLDSYSLASPSLANHYLQ